MAQIVTILIAICVLAACSVSPRPSGDDPTELRIERLASLAPRIDSRRTNLRTFQFSALLSGKFEIRIRCFFAAPSSKACFWFHDGLPVFVAASDRVLTYNSLDGPLLWQADWSVYVGHAPSDQSLSSETPDFHARFGLFDRGNPRAGVLIDLKQFVAAASLRRSLVTHEDERFTLFGYTKIGHRLGAWIDLGRPLPYMRFRFDGSDAALDIETLVANQPIPAAALQFPKFEDHITLQPPVTLTFENWGELVKAMREFPLRVGLRDPSSRPELEAKLGRRVDWDALAERDATIGHKLKLAVEGHLRGIP